MAKKPIGQNVTAKQILDLLRTRHTPHDIFVSECKDGPTLYGSPMRLDAWVMNKSWVNPVMTGYEIKVTRNDFLQDTKWTAYLRYCNMFSFVCPWGMIEPDELSKEVGLLYRSKTGSRLFIKKKAVYRDVEFPEDLIRYVLMSRCRIDEDYQTIDKRTAKAYWQKWVKDKQIDHEFGQRVSVAINQTIRHKINAVQAENDRLIRLMKAYDDIRSFIEALGIEPDSGGRWLQSTVEEKYRRLSEAVPGELKMGIKLLRDNLKSMLLKLDGLDKNKGTQNEDTGDDTSVW